MHHVERERERDTLRVLIVADAITFTVAIR